MKKVVNSLIIGAVLGSAAFASGVVTATKVSDDLSKVDASSALWKKAKFSTIELFPQTTIDNNDKQAMAISAKEGKKVAKVAALQNGKDIAFLMQWKDGTASVQKTTASNSFGDGFAVQFAKNYSDATKLPYIGMGSDARPVVVFLRKNVEGFKAPTDKYENQLSNQSLNMFGDELAKRNADMKKAMANVYQKAFISEGFRSMTEIKDSKATTDLKYAAGNYNGTLKTSMNDEALKLSGSAIPVAFAIWDGANNNRDGSKFLSSWVSVELASDDAAKKYSTEVSKMAKGDVKAGAKIASEQCAACHKLPGMDAPKFMAPGLENIGGYSTYSYLKESIMDPNAAIVPGYNRNAHPNTQWYNLDEKGVRTSNMPPFALEEKDLENLITYLQTLKRGAK